VACRRVIMMGDKGIDRHSEMWAKEEKEGRESKLTIGSRRQRIPVAPVVGRREQAGLVLASARRSIDRCSHPDYAVSAHARP